jgi:benzoyl-CoA-dihydrodiol lyase
MVLRPAREMPAPYNKSMGPGRSAGIALETHPEQYRHWRLSIEPPLATLTMAVAEEAPLVPGYKLKLNSYDLGVDIELADAVARLRFEHPEVRAVIVTGGLDRVFCAGANIQMLATSTHGFKVNFCKYTNETRLAMEDASAHSRQHYIAACNGVTAGGGYELALACEEIYLVDDGNSTVSLPEVPLLGVLPGTGGLTRLVDKRKVRRDLADVFSTLAEGIKGKRAAEWRLVDGVFPRGRFAEAVRERALALAAGEQPCEGPGIVLDALSPEATADSVRYRHVELKLDHENRTAELIVDGPQGAPPDTPETILRAGADFWPLRAFREIDDALLRLRFHYDKIGLVALKTRGDLMAVRQIDTTLYQLREDWLVNEILLLMARTLRRLDLTARSLFAVVEEGSCFAGSLLEMALAADRIYMLRDAAGRVRVASSPLNGGLVPMTHGLSRLQVRFMAEPERVEEIAGASEPFETEAAERAGLATAAVDAIDWEDELRVAIEERVSLSPDALTGMEANLRFAGAENPDSKIFSRLSAWQNWIFSRPNATGERGALTLYGKPERPQFDWRRT